MPASDSSWQEMLTERVQEAVTYFFHFTSLSIHHCFRHNRVWSLVTLPFMYLRISLVNPFRSWCFWPLQLPLAMNLKRTLCMSLSWAPLRRPVLLWQELHPFAPPLLPLAATFSSPTTFVKRMEEERVERDQNYVRCLKCSHITDLYSNTIMGFSASFPRNSCFSF